MADQGPRGDDYIRGMIERINSDANTVRAAALALLLTALYLAITVLSASDEALLRESATELQQIGVSIDIVTSFALAPPAFVFLHLNVLIQIVLLTRKMQQLDGLLLAEVSAGEDRKRWRSLLSNVSFVQVLADAGSDGMDRLARSLLHVLVWITLYIVPFMLMVSVEVSFIRYQSDLITWSHLVFLTAQLLALIWFWRQTAVKPDAATSKFAQGLCNLAVALTFLLWVNGQVPGPNATTVGPDKQAETVLDWLRQPLDLGICATWRKGCRYLDVSNLLLVSGTPPADAIGKLREFDMTADAEALAQIEGLALRDRTLRFANFSESRLYRVDLRAAKMEGSSLPEARLQGANLVIAQLQGADLSEAQLQGADLSEAQLQGADLSNAELRGAALNSAQLQGANLSNAQLQGVDLSNAQLQGANLARARLQGTSLAGAQLQGAFLRSAQLQGADLRSAHLQATSLADAQLQGAFLRSAQLQGANLSGADVTGSNLAAAQIACIVPPLRAALVDMREVDFASKPDDTEIDAWLAGLTSTNGFVDAAILANSPRLLEILGECDPSLSLDSLDTSQFQPSLLLTQPLPPAQDKLRPLGVSIEDFDKKLAPFLIKLACSDPNIGHGIVRRVAHAYNEQPYRLEDRPYRLEVMAELLKRHREKTCDLSEDAVDALDKALKGIEEEAKENHAKENDSD